MGRIRSLSSIIVHFLTGEFSAGFYHVFSKLPSWLGVYNKGYVLKAGAPKIPIDENPALRVKIASLDDDIEDIFRVNGMPRDRISSLLESGAAGFIAGHEDLYPASVGWAGFGRCYIRGLGFQYDFGPDGHYTFGLYTLPEARRKGLNLALMAASIKYGREKGATVFYSIVEFNNTYALEYHKKMGFERTMYISFLKILFLRISRRKDLSTGRRSVRIFIREPSKDITII